jgi:hypothetical protein
MDSQRGAKGEVKSVSVWILIKWHIKQEVWKSQGKVTRLD